LEHLPFVRRPPQGISQTLWASHLSTGGGCPEEDGGNAQ